MTRAAAVSPEVEPFDSWSELEHPETNTDTTNATAVNTGNAQLPFVRERMLCLNAKHMTNPSSTNNEPR